MARFRAPATETLVEEPPAPPVTPLEPVADLGQILVDAGRLSDAQLRDAMALAAENNRTVASTLLDLGIVSEQAIATALAHQYGLEVADLRRTTPAADAVALVPERAARKWDALALRTRPDAVLVAVADITEEALVALTKATGRRVVLHVAPRTDVRDAIDRTYRALDHVDEHVEAFEESAEALRRVAAQVRPDSSSDDAPVVRVVNLIITQGLRDRASDIHLEPQESRMRVRFRIDGTLHDTLDLPAEIGPALLSRIKIMAGMNIVERRRPQDGQIGLEIDGRALDIRVATTSTIRGEKAVLRLLDKSRPLFKSHDLGMDEHTRGILTHIAKSPYGMLICAGPTGSGKTTTLYATLSELNAAEQNIMTIEDPVEYVLPSINQIQINELAGVTFADGLKSILRQDPDIILVGEIRDVDTARIAVQSALTGHFVMSSIHATDAVLALHRFMDMGIETFLIASSVRAIIGQRLVRRICESCKESYKPDEDELAFYKELGGNGKRTFYRGAGCNFCSNTGFRDRIGVYELLEMTPSMRSLVIKRASQEELQDAAMLQGMRTLRDGAMALVNDDITTIGEIVKTIYAG